MNAPYPSLRNSHFGSEISTYRNDRSQHANNFDISLRVTLPLSRDMEIPNAQFVCRFQALNLNSIECLKFTNCYGKANKKQIYWHSETELDIDCLLVSQ